MTTVCSQVFTGYERYFNELIGTFRQQRKSLKIKFLLGNQTDPLCGLEFSSSFCASSKLRPPVDPIPPYPHHWRSLIDNKNINKNLQKSSQLENLTNEKVFFISGKFESKGVRIDFLEDDCVFFLFVGRSAGHQLSGLSTH